MFFLLSNATNTPDFHNHPSRYSHHQVVLISAGVSGGPWAGQWTTITIITVIIIIIIITWYQISNVKNILPKIGSSSSSSSPRGIGVIVITMFLILLFPFSSSAARCKAFVTIISPPWKAFVPSTNNCQPCSSFFFVSLLHHQLAQCQRDNTTFQKCNCISEQLLDQPPRCKQEFLIWKLLNFSIAAPAASEEKQLWLSKQLGVNKLGSSVIQSIRHCSKF